MTTTAQRSKEQRRRLACSYNGNAQVIEAVIGPAWFKCLRHPNRMLERFRASNKRRGAA